jgi:hypothetical protein
MLHDQGRTPASPIKVRKPKTVRELCTRFEKACFLLEGVAVVSSLECCLALGHGLVIWPEIIRLVQFIVAQVSSMMAPDLLQRAVTGFLRAGSHVGSSKSRKGRVNSQLLRLK